MIRKSRNRGNLTLSDNFFYPLKDFNQTQLKVFALWFYRICRNLESFRNNEEAQILYNSLTAALNLEEHSRKVVKAFLTRHKKLKNLTETKEIIDYFPFDYNGSTEKNYREDSSIYDKSGAWQSDTPDNINLIRAVFAGKEEIFARIIWCTFFGKVDESKASYSISGKENVPSSIIKASLDCPTVKFMTEAFHLSAEESLLLETTYIMHSIKDFRAMTNNLVNTEQDTMVSILTKTTGLSLRQIKSCLRNDRKLISYGIMNTDGEISQDAGDCIFSGDLNVYFCDVLKKDSKKETYRLSSFSVSSEENELALSLLKNNGAANILLYGAPGAGKTEYARSLVRKSGLEPLLFKNELEVNESERNNENHALSRLNCLLSLEKKDSVIIVDEAESMLSTKMNFLSSMFGGDSSSIKKGTVNTMLENSTNKVIWIVNYTSTLDESTLRRFNYSIRFKEMSRTMLRTIADTKLNKISMSRQLHDNLVELCGKYHVTGASVDNMVKTVRAMDIANQNEDKIVNDVQKVLEANSTLLYGKKKMRDNVKKSYDLSILQTSTPAEEIVQMVTNAQIFAEMNGTDDNGIRMLFYGLSGTGKTEFARYIAEKLNKKIILKRASDILGKYVGENEENIKRAFEEAEASGDILLFDEADSFFADRDKAHSGWERTMVNEFLTQMEEFSGILICTTNLKKIMDPAMQRRFHIISEFKPMDKNGIMKLLKKFFGSFTFDDWQINQLAAYTTVTPGDFNAVAGKIRFMKMDEITSDRIIEDLCMLQEEKNGSSKKTIGFCA